IQPKLLRLLQEREYERLGENVTRQADVRVITATNRDLKKRVAEGAFREDLYFRLNVIAVEMPPLRARQGDLIQFAEHYLQHFARQCGGPPDGFPDAAVGCLRASSWPGNLRELPNAVERAVILARERQILPSDLPAEVHGGAAAAAGSPDAAPLQAGTLVSLERLEESHIRHGSSRPKAWSRPPRCSGSIKPRSIASARRSGSISILSAPRLPHPSPLPSPR